jgi:PhnB protein
MAVSYIPEGSPTVTPYLAVKGVAALIDFLKATFDAKEIDRIVTPDGTIMNAEVAIGTSRLMMGDPRDHPSETAMLYVYVPDCDAVYARALAAGATSIMAPADMFYGDRSGAVQDPAGNKWWIATHKEDVPHDELVKRAAAARHQDESP